MLSSLFKIKKDTDNNLEALKYLASLNILYDLSLQGWVFDIDNKKVFPFGGA